MFDVHPRNETLPKVGLARPPRASYFVIRLANVTLHAKYAMLQKMVNFPQMTVAWQELFQSCVNIWLFRGNFGALEYLKI